MKSFEVNGGNGSIGRKYHRHNKTLQVTTIYIYSFNKKKMSQSTADFDYRATVRTNSTVR